MRYCPERSGKLPEKVVADRHVVVGHGKGENGASELETRPLLGFDR